VPAIFCFTISNDNQFTFAQAVPLSGNPLDIAWAEHGPGGLLVSVDDNLYPEQNGEATGETAETDGKGAVCPALLVLKRIGSEWRTEDLTVRLGDAADYSMDVNPEELQRALYTTETLRKYGMGEDS
jgi:hypothetical protein